MMGYLQVTACILSLVRGYTIHDLAYYLVFYFAPPVFLLSFSLEMRQLFF